LVQYLQDKDVLLLINLIYSIVLFGGFYELWIYNNYEI